jgi:hypothetical protein
MGTFQDDTSAAWCVAVGVVLAHICLYSQSMLLFLQNRRDRKLNQVRTTDGFMFWATIAIWILQGVAQCVGIIVYVLDRWSAEPSHGRVTWTWICMLGCYASVLFYGLTVFLGCWGCQHKWQSAQSDDRRRTVFALSFGFALMGLASAVGATTLLGLAHTAGPTHRIPGLVFACFIVVTVAFTFGVLASLRWMFLESRAAAAYQAEEAQSASATTAEAGGADASSHIPYSAF